MRRVIERPTKWLTHRFVLRTFDVHITYTEGVERDILAHFARYVTLLSKSSVNEQNVTLTVRATEQALVESIETLGEENIAAYEIAPKRKRRNRHEGQNVLAHKITD